MSTQLQQTEKAYKKATLNVAMTGLGGSAFFTEPPSPTVVFASNIIVNDALIPSTAPTTNLSNGTMFDRFGNVTVDSELAIIQYNEATMNAYPGSSNVSYILDSFDGLIIPFNFADGSYSPAIFANDVNGVQLPFGLNGWEFDPAAGVVTFFQGKPSSVTNNTLGIKFWTYVGPRGIVASDIEIEKREFVLSNRLSPPTDVTWNSVTNTWTVTHNLNSLNVQVDYRINGYDNSALTRVLNANSIEAVMYPVKNKSTSTETFPTDVTLVIRKI